MSDIQIYYLIPTQLNRNLNKMNIDLSEILRTGDKKLQEVRNEIKIEPQFCRNEYGIDFNYLHSSIVSDISLYASLDGKIAGLLTFMFLDKDDNRYILLNGICSPAKYSRLGVGQELINTLIRIGKAFDVNYIKLKCKGDALMNYYKKFGFITTYIETIYDEDDEDESYPQYDMQLNLSSVSGGKNNRKTFKRKSRKSKKSRRTKRNIARIKLRKYH